MKYSIAILIYILAGCTCQKNDLKITYLANCGYLYEHQSSKVLIDPFGTEFGNLFYLPTPETMNQIENGNIPFDNIDLVLITHIHGDHFNPLVAEKFLRNNKNAKMVCPPQVFKQVKDSCADFKQVEAQIISPQISMNNMKTIEMDDISVSILRLQHGTDRNLQGINHDDYTDYEKTENYGYLIDFGKKVAFHQGDACLKINKSAMNKIKPKIDIAYLSFFDWDSTSYNFLKENLHVENIIFMHGTKPAKELENEEFKSTEPKLIFYKQELESKVF